MKAGGLLSRVRTLDNTSSKGENTDMSTAHLLPNLVRQAADAHPDRVIMENVDGTAQTASQFYEHSLTWAGALEGRGVRGHDTVVVMFPPSFIALEVWLGLSYLDAIEVPVNTQYKGKILEHVLEDSRANVAVIAEEYLAQFLDAASATKRKWEIIVCSPRGTAVGLPESKTHHSLLSGPDLLESSDQPSNLHDVRSHDTSCILYTSGTTGPSKGVVVPWEQQYATAAGVLPLDDLGPEDVYYSPFPTFHVSGKFAFYCMMLVGGRVVIREQFRTESFWDDIRRFRCTTTMLLGAMTNFLYRQPTRRDDADNPLRNVLMIPVIPEAEAFKERFGVRTSTVFNMTEVSCPIISEGWESGPGGSCGKVRPRYDARLVDEHDQEVPVGQIGELVVRSSEPWTMMDGYWGLPERTIEAWRNLWFHTGDAFYQDAEGNFYFVDRMKDAIRRRGENISSAEVEAEILEHPEVVECAVVAVPSEWGEDEILAVIVAGDAVTQEELYEFCKEKLPRFMVPRYIRFVSELPKTPTSKIRKTELRELGVAGDTFEAPPRR